MYAILPNQATRDKVLRLNRLYAQTISRDYYDKGLAHDDTDRGARSTASGDCRLTIRAAGAVCHYRQSTGVETGGSAGRHEDR